jgi:methylated-DNA-[protein]-cysteine S-methyltransferase
MDIYAKEIEGIWFGVACEGDKIFATWFASDEASTVKGLGGNIPGDAAFQRGEKASAFAARAIAALKDIYDGKDVSQSFQLATEHLPDYTRKVLEATYLIPTGFVASYSGIAKAVGGGARAVGNVMARNPFAPLVPCHRVVASDFTLGGYAGGLDSKLRFLKREKRGFSSKREIPAKGGKLAVFPVEYVLKKNEHWLSGES